VARSSPVDLATSAVSFAWAAGLFGAEQIASVLTLDDQPRRTSRRLYSLTAQVQEHLGSILWAVFQLGDNTQRTTMDALFDVAEGRRGVASLGALAREAGSRGLDGIRTWATAADGSAAAVQLANNLEVYQIVRNVRDVLGLPPHGPFPLDVFVAEAYATGSFASLWAIEGLGFEYADRLLDAETSDVNPILDSEWTGSIPRSSLTMLHAGFGLAFARRLLPCLTPFDSEARIAEIVEEFLGLCAAHSRAGYAGAAQESLGLVARTWHAQLMHPIDRQLARLDGAARERFWHGAGRALYFHPLHIVPGFVSPWPAAASEPPDAIARLNMWAGLAWATALVNRRHPDVLLDLIAGRGAELAADDAFSSGVASALLMTLDIAGGDGSSLAICRECPAGVESPHASAWDALVGAPCRYASSGLLGLLSAHALLGELFRYRPFPEWFADALVRFKEPIVQ
jgi:hypothetical protein